MKKLFFTLEILLLCFYFCQAQYVLKGRIMDEISFKPIENVYLTIDKAKTGTLSSSTGYFEIYIEKLPATITFSHVTYEKKLVKLSEEDFSANNEKIINIELSAKAIETKMVDIVEHRFGKMLDTTPKVDYIGFTITKQGFIYALVKRQDNTYLRIYNLEDSVLSEKKVEKKLSQIWSFKGDIYIGSDLNLNKNYDDITKTYQICKFLNDSIILLPKMDLPNGSVWLFDMLKLNDLYYQINHLYHPYKTLYILYRSKKLKLEPDNGEKFYVAAYGGASVLYRNPVDYAKIEQDFENGKYKKAFNRYLRKTQLITEDIGAIKKKYIDSLYDIYFRKTIEIVENEGYYNYFEFFRAAPPPEIQSPIVLYLKDTLCIMNFFNLDLIKLDTMGRYINKMKLNNEDFGLYIPQFNRLVPDVISQKMYSVSNRNGLVSMSVIDFKKGSCLEERYYLKRTPKSIYNILIYGDYVYYLAHYDTWRVGLFKEKIEYKNTEE